MSDPYIDAISDLEQKLSEELDLFIADESNHTETFLTKLNEFELARVDSETEATFDKLQVLMLQCSEFKKQIEILERERSNLLSENSTLKSEVAYFKKVNHNNNPDIGFGIQNSPGSPTTTTSSSSTDLQQVADLQARLERAKQAQSDHQLARSVAEKELLQERMRRMRCEKGSFEFCLYFQLFSFFILIFIVSTERDAYAAAYEASLKHFDRWSQKKNVKRSSSSAKQLDQVAEPTAKGDVKEYSVSEVPQT
jgi:hypothetical protein